MELIKNVDEDDSYDVELSPDDTHAAARVIEYGLGKRTRSGECDNDDQILASLRCKILDANADSMHTFQNLRGDTVRRLAEMMFFYGGYIDRVTARLIAAAEAGGPLPPRIDELCNEHTYVIALGAELGSKLIAQETPVPDHLPDYML